MPITLIERGTVRPRGEIIFEVKRTDSFNDDSDAAHSAPRIGTVQVARNGYWAVFAGRSVSRKNEVASGKAEDFDKAVKAAEQQAETILG